MAARGPDKAFRVRAPPGGGYHMARRGAGDMDEDADDARMAARAARRAERAIDNHSVRRINRLFEALGGQRYLEIGVRSGETFLGVAAAEKVAVDPVFKFTPEPLPGVTYHQITSDLYFSEHARGAFDVIFIDGLHTFEQTFRDFCSSLAHAKPGTVWVIDDTLPSDVFSAVKVQRQAIRFRRLAGGRGANWHGDVYKVVFAIADFFPSFSYATIEGGGNPQTLVWQGARTPFRPALDSLEAISRLDYFALQDRIEVLNRMTEDEALAAAIEGARKARDSR
jgi:hypothetical protein